MAHKALKAQDKKNSAVLKREGKSIGDPLTAAARAVAPESVTLTMPEAKKVIDEMRASLGNKTFPDCVPMIREDRYS